MKKYTFPTFRLTVRAAFALAVLFFSVLLLSFSESLSAQETRKMLFNSDWRFSKADISNASEKSFDDSEWRLLALPHDWSIEGQRDAQEVSGGDGGFFPTGKAWYRKSFKASKAWKGKKVSVYFEGVYMNSEVFLNGKSLGIQPYGYSSFEYDLTPYLEYNKNNVLAVSVDNSQQKNCRWYSGSGIYRHVWLRVTDPLHFSDWGVYAFTKELNTNSATVQVKALVRNESKQTQQFTVQAGLWNAAKQNAGRENSTLTLSAGESREVLQEITVSNPALWSPESPNLYTLELTIFKGKRKVDVLRKAVGIRSIDFSAENGFRLNGQKVLLNGGCVHHDNGSLGAAAFDRAEIRKVKLLKAAGFNAVRTSHNPPSEAFLDACDSIGLLVIDEIFDGWRTAKNPHDYAKYFDKWWRHDLEAMVLRDHHHPSIILWSIGNEIIERTSPQAVETAKMLASAVHEMDPTRPVTSAMTTWGNEGWEVFDPLMAAHDVAGYNYQLHRVESDHERVPSRIILQTESYPRDAFFCWDMSQKHDYVIGDFVWTAMDYLGESGIGRYVYPGEPAGEHWEGNLYPWHGAYCGDIDLTGWRKPISHYRDMLWNNTQKLCMAVREPNPATGKIKLTSWAVWPTWEHWTWPGAENKDLDVEIYSKYETIRLYLNDKLLAEKVNNKANEYKTTFTVPYQAGVLKAEGLENGIVKESTTLQTAAKAERLKLTADRQAMKADGQDLIYVTVEITDAHGVLNPAETHRLKFELSGPGVIAGVDNGNLKDTDLYTSNTRNTFNGRAMVVIRSTPKAGKIELKVSGYKLETQSVIVRSKAKR